MEKPCDRYGRRKDRGIPEIGTPEELRSDIATCTVLRNMIAIEHCRFM